jgi:membrane-bound lytic murein transglycosylase A
MKLPDTRIEPIAWGDLDGWADDDHAAAFATFLRSCRALVHGGVAPRPARSMHAALAAICRRALSAPTLDRAQARAFFEANFRPLRITKLGQSEGFLTGYYEPIAEGSRVRTEDFTVPLYRRPGDLVTARSRRKGEFPNKGAVLRKVGKRKFVPYFDRAEIEDGALDGRQLEICWLKNPIDAFFIQIQGSARIRLQDGTMLRVNYDAHNGQPYTPVGRILIDRNIISKDEMSMDRIRDWMEANPVEGRELRRRNKSFVFFRVVHLPDHDEPRGGQGVALTPGRSIAVDKALHAYGTPFFIEADLPIAGEQPDTKFRRLMIAQDTGSAIVGPARADIYFGAGDEAEHVAGRIRHPGRFAMLVPRELDPARIGPHVPLPPQRPDTVPVAVRTSPRGVEAASAGPASMVPLPSARPEAAPTHRRSKRERGASVPRPRRVKPVS